MEALRTHPFLARLVLAWFVLFVGASVASPIIEPSATQLICSANGTMKLVASDIANDDGQAQSSAVGMDCPLCSPIAHALPTSEQLTLLPSGLGHALQPAVAARLAWLTRSPLPARGPPSFS
jgi:hypothetical protein